MVSHRTATRSSPAVSSFAPSPEKATLRTGPPCPLYAWIGLPLRASKVRASLSLHAVTTCSSRGPKAIGTDGKTGDRVAVARLQDELGPALRIADDGEHDLPAPLEEDLALEYLVVGEDELDVLLVELARNEVLEAEAGRVLLDAVDEK